MLEIVPNHKVDEIWPFLAADFEAACRSTEAHEFNAGVLWQMCRSGTAYLILWVVDGEILLKSVWRFNVPKDPHSFRCIMLSGRNMRRWVKAFHEEILKLAKLNGANRLTVSGRKGWLKLIPNSRKNGDDFEVEI